MELVQVVLWSCCTLSLNVPIFKIFDIALIGVSIGLKTIFELFFEKVEVILKDLFH